MIFQEGAMSSSVRVSISRQERIPATGAVQGTGPPEIQEPYIEINDFDDFTEIIMEIPGINREDISETKRLAS